MMKQLYILILSIFCLSAYAQSADKGLDEIITAEKKSASKKMLPMTNPNTYDYDIVYHRLRLTVDPADYFVSGEVTTKYIALQNINSVTFDLSNDLDVSSVKRHGVDLPFTRSANNELIINLPVTQNINVLDSVSITYSGVPPTTGFGAFTTTTHNSTPVLYTLSEPFGAMEWWPCKQDLNDKVNSIDVYITAPSTYIALSNGLQTSAVVNGDGTKTTHFHHGYAIPAYLIAIAVTNYQIYNQQGGLGTVASPFFPIINYIYPENATPNIASVAVTPNIINFYETKFGPYPFRNEKYGHAQFGWGGGMEHTTVSFMTADNGQGGYTRGLIAHEMGHQWFGDKVTCGSWKDIWLNEGFATYMASMVIQNFDGEAAFTTDKGNMINTITSSTGGAIYLTDLQALDVNRIFNSQFTYKKGAMVLNMLRFKLGDTNFFQGLRNYLSDPALAYGYALTPNLQAHLEATSGMSLTEFFNDWVYKEGYPTYSITAYNNAPGQARITINQTQSNPTVTYFEMPVPVRLLGAGGQTQDLVLDNTFSGQVYNLTVPFVVTGVQFNVKKDIISKNSTATLGTSDFDVTAGIVLYPNPASNSLNLQLPQGVTVEKTVFYNTLGQKVKESTSETSWDVSSLATGVHFITVYTNLGKKEIKFIKE